MAEEDLFPEDPVAVLEDLRGIPFRNKVEELVGAIACNDLMERHDGARPAIINSIRILLKGGVLPPVSTPTQPKEKIRINDAAGED